MHFYLRIELGNDAMSKTEHLKNALIGVANRLEDKGYLEDIEDGGEWMLPFTRGIVDANGNYVGEWKFSEEE